MSLEVVKKYTPEEAEAGRLKVLEKDFVPPIKKIFDQYPKIESAVLLIGQYWSDDAYDRIQYMLPFSIETQPDYERWLAYIEDPDQEDQFWSSKEYFIEGLRGATEAAINFDAQGNSTIETQTRKELNHFDNDYIPLFSAFCKEGGHQDASYAHNYTPYAIFRRGDKGADIDIEIVGEMLRPWLDGVMPLAEQYEGNYPETEAYSDSLEPVFPESEREIGPVRLEKAAWSKAETATGKAYLGVQNALDKWAEADAKPEKPLSEFDVLKAVLAILVFIALIMTLMTLAGIQVSTG